MAAVNSVQAGLRLPLTGIAPPRLLMCSASMGAEGSVTLQLREAIQAPEAQLDANSFTIGYPESDLLADMLGSIQSAANGDVSFNILDARDHDISNAIISKSSPISTSVESESVLSNNNNNNSNSNNNNSNNSNNNNHSSSNNNNNNNSNKNNNNNNKNENNNISGGNETSVPVQNSTMIKKVRPRTASPTRHGPQQCQTCSKVFGNASALAKHKLTHSDERKYVCGMCSKAFKRQDHLNGHMLTHRNKKPYECKAEGCGKSYCDARSLRRHTENHHSSLAMTPTTPNQSLSSSTGPPTGLSLSPATASGDASSPHGANCVQFNGGDGSKPSSPSSPAGAGNEGLTRQQLDLISQIMQQTKQANAGLTATSGHKPVQRPRTWNMQTQLQQNQSKLSPNPDAGNAASSNGQNAVKLEQKPVECNLCHRKFKNIPALNGHMRLHGGYFKKDAEPKKCDKKESAGPPLQTASIGIRALIEEKIISKRGKDIKNGFVVPAAPLTVRRLGDLDNFATPKTPTTISAPIQTTIVTSGASQTTSLTNISPAMTTIAATVQLPNTLRNGTTIETKDATLIELLKRGTKVAVKRAITDGSGQLTFSQSTAQTTTVLLPSQATIATPLTSMTPMTPTSTPPLSISLANNTVTSAPLALTISQTPADTDVYTLAYSTDSPSAFFGDNDVYNVPDTAMLLQAVDSIQLLQNTSTDGHLDDLTTIGDYTLTNNGDLTDSTILTRYTPSRQLQAVLNSPLPDSLAEFSTLHSKDYVLYGCTSTCSPTTQSTSSPLPSPLSYPTPPASHEGVTQSSPFLDDTHHFSDANSFFDDKKNINFLEDNSASYFRDPKDEELTEDERILKLKNELFNETKSVIYFKTEPQDVYETKASDLLGDSQSPNEAIVEFNQNLSFLDEPQNFLDDARNTSSPLSAAFFTSAMSSAEEVKEALEEVLPNENMPCETSGDIDLYYLPSFQSQMMLNSDDPLLSSSPKDFANKAQVHKFDFDHFNPPNCKKPKLEMIASDEKKMPLLPPPSELTISKDVFLSPSSVSSGHSVHSSRSTASSTSANKRPLVTPRKNVIYKSKLRQSSIARYTPSPMLNPERLGPGLYSSITRDILDDVLDFNFNETDIIPEIIEKSRVNIGSDFQASIPQLFDDDEIPSYDQQLWDPCVLTDERQLQRFVDLAKSSSVPLGCHSEEMALQALQDANGETHVAIFAMLQATPAAIHNRWQQREIEIFLKGLEDFGKDFRKISKEIPNKTTGECVQFYYFWKKLCVDYKWTHLNSEQAVPDATTATPAITISSHVQEARPHVCEMPDCSASFTSKAALHGHTRIHCIGRSLNSVQSSISGNSSTSSSNSLTPKDDYPCKVCGKVFNKVKSRSAHMKSHRPQDSETTTT